MFKVLPPKKTFQFRHCWMVLRNQPKWHDKLKQLAELKTSNKKKKTTKDSSPGVVDLEVDNEDVTAEPVTPEADVPQRPIGKKRAKEALRRGGKDAGVEALELLWAKKKEADAEKELKQEERYAKTYALDKERLAMEEKIEQKRLEHECNSLHIKRMAEEERIINMDLNCLNELQKQYYTSLQVEIMARRLN